MLNRAGFVSGGMDGGTSRAAISDCGGPVSPAAGLASAFGFVKSFGVIFAEAGIAGGGAGLLTGGGAGLLVGTGAAGSDGLIVWGSAAAVIVDGAPARCALSAVSMPMALSLAITAGLLPSTAKAA